MSLDDFAEQKAKYHGRQESDDQIDNEAPRSIVAIKITRDMCNALAVFPANSEHGAGLYNDFKDFDFLAGEIEQTACENQMPGRGDGKKFRQSFDDAHDDDFYGKQNFHAIGRQERQKERRYREPLDDSHA